MMEQVCVSKMTAKSFQDKALRSLPIRDDLLNIRLSIRSDLELFTSWPQYSLPYNTLSFSFISFNKSRMDRYYREQIKRVDRIILVTDHKSDSTIGYVSLNGINWEKRSTEKMSVRIHPNWCNKGIGTRTIKLIRDWWFMNDMNSLQLDVASTNQRAIQCYKKAGFQKTGEFWREALDFKNVDLGDAKYAFAKDNVRFEEDIPKIRFYWMEVDRST